MVSIKMRDSSRRLFGFESDQHGLDNDILVVETGNELETMIAQDIYIRFLQKALGQIGALGGGVDVIAGLQSSYILQNSRVHELMLCFERNNLGSGEDALMCMIPVLRHQSLLPALGADTAGIRNRIEDEINGNRWSSALGIAFWICGWSEGPELKRSVYELGYLCIRALLSKDTNVQELGAGFVQTLYMSNVRTLHMATKRVQIPAAWSESSEYIEWSESFSKQLGWVAWHIQSHMPSPARKAASLWIQNDTLQGQVHDLPLFSRTTTLPDLRLDEDFDLAARYTIQWLIDDNLNVDNEFTGEEVCQWALEKKHHALLYFVLLRWAEVGERYPNIIQLAYTAAAKSCSSWSIRVLQQRDVNINAINENNISALMEVTATGEYSAVQVLLEAGANPDGHDESRDARPLFIAAYEGRTDIVELLLQHGANIEALDSMEQSALHWARRGNQLAVVRLLLSRGAAVDSCGLNYESTLHSAVAKGQLEICQLLLNHGADINKPDGNFGYTPLIFAARTSPDDMLCGQVDIIRLLLSKGANVFSRDSNGLNAYDWAKRKDLNNIAAILELAMHENSPR
jgi:ankyrin repeat protein